MTYSADTSAERAKDASTDAACVFLNTGSGSFPATPTCYSLTSGLDAADAVALGDVDKDGKLDVVLTYSGHNGITGGINIDVYLGKGDGTLGTPTPYTLSADLFQTRVLDVNNDGYADYVGYENNQTLDGTSSQLDVLLNDGTGKLAATASHYSLGTVTEYASLATGDFAANGLVGFAAGAYDANMTPQLDTIVATCKQ